MKSAKKLLALLLVLVMALGMMAGCASNQKPNDTTADSGKDTTASSGDTTAAPQETVTIKWHRTAWRANPDNAKVADAINAYIEPLIGVKVEILGDTEYDLNMMLSSGEDVDLFFTAIWGGALEYINANAVMDITDMIDNYPELKASIPDRFWDTCYIDNKLFFVPNQKEAGLGIDFAIPTSVYEKYCPDLTEIEDIADLTPIMQAMKDDGITYPYASENWYTDGKCVVWDYYNVNNLLAVDDNLKVVNTAETPEYKHYCETIYSWGQAGFFPQTDIDRSTIDHVARGEDQGFISWPSTPDGAANASVRFGTDMTIVSGGRKIMDLNGTFASAYAISSNSTKADACLKFLQLLFTDETLANLVCFGIEGEHYDMVDGRIQVREESNYKYPGVWITCNVMTPGLQVGESEDKKEQYADFNDSCTISPISGFVFDYSNCETEYTACTAARKEYYDLLERGFYDPAEFLPKLQKDLKNAGIDTLVAECQAQLDAWLAANGK